MNKGVHAVEEARTVWMRMIALLFVFYRLLDEPAYLLAASDRLLNNLLECLSKSKVPQTLHRLR